LSALAAKAVPFGASLLRHLDTAVISLDLASVASRPCNRTESSCHNRPECIAKLIRVEVVKQSAEGVAARQGIGEHEQTAKKSLFRLGKRSHIDRALAAVSDNQSDLGIECSWSRPESNKARTHQTKGVRFWRTPSALHCLFV
jgi:hypothetical protein